MMKRIHIKPLVLFCVMTLSTTECRQETKKQQESDNEIVTVYSHGYMCNKWFAKFFHTDIKHPNKANPHAFILGHMESFNYADWFNPFLCRLGQGDDIERLHEACKKHAKVIIVGTSRGAAAIANYLGTYKPTNIMGVVLESPFDDGNNVADNVMAQCPITDKEGAKKTMTQLFFSNYDPAGMQPIKAAPHINTQIPMLIICSESDGLIPASSTINLYNALRASGHTRVHLLVCKYGSHGRILWSKDGKTFKNVVHAFYKQYNLPYHELWAQEGLERFQEC